MLQVEDREAIERIAEIVAVPGVDLVLVGPADLAASYGFPGEPHHPVVRAAIEKMVAAAREAGVDIHLKAGPPEEVRGWIARGVRCFVCGSDGQFIAAHLSELAARYRPLAGGG